MTLVSVPARWSERAVGRVRELTGLLRARLGGEPVVVDDVPEPAAFDLDGLRPLIAAVRGALDGAGAPLVVAGECTVALAALPWLAERHPAARLLWIDAHGDLNTPRTSASGYLGGMPLAAATGLWDAGVTPTLSLDRVVLCGVRDLDPAERELVEREGVPLPEPAGVPAALGDAPVFVHLDCDAIAGYPAAFPAPGGPSEAQVRDVLAAVAARGPVVGLSIASVAGDAAVPARVVEPLL